MFTEMLSKARKYNVQLNDILIYYVYIYTE